MIDAHLSKAVLELAPEDRLELARQLVASLIDSSELASAVREGIRRIDEVADGRVAGLTESQFRALIS